MIIVVPGFVILYVGLCCLLGLIGRNSKFGFWGNFWVSVVFTPLVGIVVLFAQDLRGKPRNSSAS